MILLRNNFYNKKTKNKNCLIILFSLLYVYVDNSYKNNIKLIYVHGNTE